MGFAEHHPGTLPSGLKERRGVGIAFARKNQANVAVRRDGVGVVASQGAEAVSKNLTGSGLGFVRPIGVAEEERKALHGEERSGMVNAVGRLPTPFGVPEGSTDPSVVSSDRDEDGGSAAIWNSRATAIRGTPALCASEAHSKRETPG